jgi:hypothetical protein
MAANADLRKLRCYIRTKNPTLAGFLELGAGLERFTKMSKYGVFCFQGAGCNRLCAWLWTGPHANGRGRSEEWKQRSKPNWLPP